MITIPRVAYGMIMSRSSSELETQHPVVAIDKGGGEAICVTLDKGWTTYRSWGEVEVAGELGPYSSGATQEGDNLEGLLKILSEVRAKARAWEDTAKAFEERLSRQLEGRMKGRA